MLSDTNPVDGHGTAAIACGEVGSTARLPAFQHYYAPRGFAERLAIDLGSTGAYIARAP